MELKKISLKCEKRFVVLCAPYRQFLILNVFYIKIWFSCCVGNIFAWIKNANYVKCKMFNNIFVYNIIFN